MRARVELGVDPREELAVAHGGVACLEVLFYVEEGGERGLAGGGERGAREDGLERLEDAGLPVLLV